MKTHWVILFRLACLAALLPLTAPAFAQPANWSPTLEVIQARVTTSEGVALEVAFSEGSALHLRRDEARESLRVSGEVTKNGKVRLTLEALTPEEVTSAVERTRSRETLMLELGGEPQTATLAPLTFELLEATGVSEVTDPARGCDRGSNVSRAFSRAPSLSSPAYGFVDNTGPGGGPARCCTYCAGWQGCCEVWQPGACCEVWSPCNGYCQACAPVVQQVNF